MKEPRRAVNRVAPPVKTSTQRLAYVALLLGAIGLMVFGRTDAIMIEKARSHIVDTVAPILEVLSQPIVTINSLIKEGRAILSVRSDNLALRSERDRLLHWELAARQLQEENQILKGLLNFEPGPSVGFISGRVVADTGGAFVHSMIINAGSTVGVGKGNAVITGDGLLGRVAHTGERASRVLLITDLNSRIPIVIESSRVRAIMVGTNANRPRLIHLPTGATTSVGDRVVTSGHGGVFPMGIPVGIVSSVGEGHIEVQPFVNRERVEYVRVIDYGLNGIIQNMNNANAAKKDK